MDTVTVLLHRLGVAYTAIMNPVFRVRRNPAGELLDVHPAAGARRAHATVSTRPGSTSSWRRRRSQGRRRGGRAAAQRARRRAAGGARLGGAQRHPGRARQHAGRRPRRALPVLRPPRRRRAAALARRRALRPAGLPAVLGRATARPRSTRPAGSACCGCAPTCCRSSPARTICWCWRRPPCRATCATARTRTSWWSARTLPGQDRRHRAPVRRVVHRGRDERQRAGDPAHLAARQRGAGAVARRPQPSRPADARHHPDHPALGAVLAQRADSCSTWPTRSSTSVRAAARCCSCAPTSSRTSCPAWCTCRATATPPRSDSTMQDILVRELGGESIEYTARVSESPWAVVHFTVRLPDGTTPAGRRHVAGERDQDPGSADRGRPHLGRPADRLGEDGCDQPGRRRALLRRVPRGLQAGVHPARRDRRHRDHRRAARQFGEAGLRRRRRGPARQPHLVPRGRSASLSELLPMLQCMGVVVLEERPFTVTRADGMPVWIYQFKISPHQSIREDHDAAEREATATRFADAVTAIWQGRVEIDRFNELVMRAGPDLAAGHGAAQLRKVPAAGGFSVQPVAHRDGRQRQRRHRARAGRALRGAVRSGDAQSDSEQTKRDAPAAAAAVAADIDALVSLDTDRVLRAFASMIQATLRTNYFVTSPDSARSQNVLSIKLNPGLIDELPLPRPRYEIFVYSPRVEGVHLRFGNVARGGLRWSDRREDFRTEILGLVKAQAVKNAVIVPVGAKGGFVAEEPAGAHRRRRRRPRRAAQRGRRLLPAVHLRPARRHRQRRHRNRRRHPARGRGAPRRRRRLPRGRRRQGHGDVLRHRQRRREVLRVLARRRVRLRRLGRLRPQGDGHHRQGRVGVGEAALPRDGRRHPDRGLHGGRRRRHER